MSRFSLVGVYRIKRSSCRATAWASSNQVFRVVAVISAPIRALTLFHTSAAGFMAVLLRAKNIRAEKS